MKTYTYSQLLNAIPFNKISYCINIASYVKKKLGKKTFTWNEINEVLYEKKVGIRDI